MKSPFTRSQHIWRPVLLALLIAPICATGQAPPVPGPEHERLKTLEGTWTATVKMGDGESKGTMTYKLECGGLWLVSDFRGEFEGQAFQGKGMDGFDPVKKKYVSVWVDSWSTQPLLLEGTHDKETNTTTMTGEGMGPDGGMAKYKMVTRLTSDDHHTFTMFLVGDDGQDVPMMTIDYTRKK